MFQFYHKLSKPKKLLFLIVTIPLSALIGAIGGLFLGLIATTFIPMSCGDTGCHNSFELNGMVGYEATGFIGFWVGMILAPIFYIFFVLSLGKKTKY